jgi:type III secretion system FlhB-like substrate exporter
MTDKYSLPLAVALKYETGTREAPRVVAKGHGHVAERIVALAADSDVVIETNPELAQALSGVGLEQTVPIALFEAVAEVIVFVLRARDRMQVPIATPVDSVDI